MRKVLFTDKDIIESILQIGKGFLSSALFFLSVGLRRQASVVCPLSVGSRRACAASQQVRRQASVWSVNGRLSSVLCGFIE